MKSIVTLSLSGRAFQVEEEGYAKLREYLAAVEARATEGERGEAVDAAERELAGHLSTLVNASKTVVTARDVEEVLRRVSTVAQVGGAAAPAPKRKLYRIREGQMISGLCNGLAAYSQIDVAMVRSLFVILGLFSGGLLVVLYLIAMFIVPVADSAN